MKKKIPKLPKALSIFTLAMINVAAISSVKSWPFIAEFGFSSLFYLILAALVFFIPISLVSAELATGWPKKGGVYLWVKEAFGEKWGFLAIWLQWIENVVWYPTVLSFTAATITYVFNPSLAGNTVYTVIAVLILIWGATLANFYGMKTSGWISNVGAICGTLIPGAVIIIFGFIWIAEGSPLHIQFTWDHLIPNFSLTTMVFFTGVMLSFAGMEMSAVHALDVRSPKRDYPRAILLSALLIILPTILGALAISAVIPREEMSLTAGTMQAFSVFFKKYHIQWAIPLIALLTSIGLFGSVSTWIIGPAKGLLAAGEKGDLPKYFHKTNKRGAPVNIMMAQGLIATALSMLFLLMPTVSSGFWILTVLVAQLYLIMYIMVFAAGLKLRYSKSKTERPYKVPGGRTVMWLVCVLGIIGSLFALLIGYIPPAQIETGSSTFYTGFLIAGTLIGVITPFIILRFKKPSWNKWDSLVNKPKR